MQIHQTREAWLNAFAVAMRPIFEALHAPLPAKVRIAVAFTSGGSRGKRIGECWSSEASGDGHFEIMIRPDYDDANEIAAILVHELIHAAVGLQEKHKGWFKAVALAIGLEGKMTATTASARLLEALKPILEALGEMPHAKLNFRQAKKKQATAMVKCECGECGYIVRTTNKWLDNVGAPWCPVHGEMFVCN